MAKARLIEEKSSVVGAVERMSVSSDQQSREQIEALKGEIAENLGRLRPLLREALEKYLARLEAEILQLSEAVKAQDAAAAPGRVRRGLEKIRARVTDLSVKPEKARRKDLKRIEEFLEKSWETAQGW
jgi:hypothetical protein